MTIKYMKSVIKSDDDVNWMDKIFLSNNKVSKHRLGPFEYT